MKVDTFGAEQGWDSVCLFACYDFVYSVWHCIKLCKLSIKYMKQIGKDSFDQIFLILEDKSNQNIVVIYSIIKGEDQFPLLSLSLFTQIFI